MKLLRIETNGRTIPCVLDADSKARDVSSLIDDFSPVTAPTVLDTLANVDLSSLPTVDTNSNRILPPMSQPTNIFCIGLNYTDHAIEAGLEPPAEPVLFSKFACAYCAPNDPILYASGMSKLDWEVELGVVIKKTAFNVSKQDALDHVLGYTVVNDVSERAWQQERCGQWVKGKSFPNFCPTGPWLVTGDEVGDAKELDMWLDVNGNRMQTGNTRTMIFDVATIVSYVSEFTRLEAGDLICTGTPPGVALGMNPSPWLKIGDKVALGIEGLGEQAQEVTAI